MTTDAVTAAATLADVRNGVMIITINRPAARNAVNAAVSTGIGNALEQARSDSQIRAVVITGAGDKSFCAGADLKALSRGESVYHPEHPEWGFAGFVRHFIDKPVLAAVNGTALGGGAEMVLACDLVVAGQSTTLGLPEVKRGLIAGAGGAFRIMDQLPPKIAAELLFTGDPLPAVDAAKWGLVNKVVPDEDVLDAALGLAERIAANAPLSVQSSKRVAFGVDLGVVTDEQAAWQRSERESTELLKSEDAREGPRAFAEKRPPIWKAR